jgi:hypothetical protein
MSNTSGLTGEQMVVRNHPRVFMFICGCNLPFITNAPKKVQPQMNINAREYGCEVIL